MLLDLNPYGGNDNHGMFPLFYKQVARELTRELAVIFMHLVKRGGVVLPPIPVVKGSSFL